MAIDISEEKLRELMLACYEAGWYGVLELKDDFVDDLLNEKRLKAEAKIDSPTFTIGSGLGDVHTSAPTSFIMSSGPSIQQTFGFTSTVG